MKQQVARFSPHQNGKVFGVLSALGSLVFLVPFYFVFLVSAPAGARGSPPAIMFLLAPIFYLVFGYLSVAIGCLFYNFMFRFLGGIEYEAQDERET